MIVGQKKVVDDVLMTHFLRVAMQLDCGFVPGLAKTLLVRSLSRNARSIVQIVSSSHLT